MGVSVGFTIPLLNEDKQPTIIHNHYYPPLNAEQADIYMGTKEYLDSLDERVTAIFCFLNKKNRYQPMVLEDKHSGERRSITFAQAKKLIDLEKTLKKPRDKEILMTKGIGALPKGVLYKEYSSKSNLMNYICFLCLFPCIIQECYKDITSEVPLIEPAIRPAIIKVTREHFNYLDRNK